MCKNPAPTSSTESTEAERIQQILGDAKLIDIMQNKEYDRFTSLASRNLNVPIALVSLEDVSKLWFKARVGVPQSEIRRNVSFCSYTILESSPDVMVVPDALQDDRFHEIPVVVKAPFIRFYAGAALRVQGNKVGALCVIDTKPRHDFGAKEQQTLLDIAGMVSSLIEARRSSVFQLEQELAHITMSVLYSIKQPLEALTEVSRVVDGKWRHLQASSMASRVEHDQQDPEAVKEQPQEQSHEQSQQSLRQETIAAVQEDAILLQDKADILKLFLDLSLKAASRLLDMGQSGSKHPRLVACDLEGLISKAEAMVSRCSPSCEMDLSQRFENSGHCKITLSPSSSPTASDLLNPCYRSYAGLFSHPDLLLLTMISLIVFLEKHNSVPNLVSIEKEEFFQGVNFNENHVSGIIDTNIGTGTVRRRHLKLPECSSWCGGSLKMVIMTTSEVNLQDSNFQWLHYLVENVGGILQHNVDSSLCQSVFTLSIPYMQLEPVISVHG